MSLPVRVEVGSATGEPTVAGVLEQVAAESGITRRAVLSLSKDENPKLVTMLFGDSDEEPRLAVKVGFTPAAAQAVRVEGRSLRALRGLRSAFVEHTTPRFVSLTHATDGTVLVTTGCAGVPMSVTYHRWGHTASRLRVRGDFAAADRWLSEFHQPSGVMATRGQWDERLADRWAGDSSLISAVRAVRNIQQRLDHREAAVMVHGDFWAGNLLMTGAQVTGVVDWEHASVGGDPLRDRVRFALSYLLYLDRHTRPGRLVRGHPGLVAGEWGASIRHGLDGRCWCSRLVADFLTPCLPTEKTGVEWREALLLGLAEVAVLSDDTTFAHHHLTLLASLAATVGRDVGAV